MEGAADMPRIRILQSIAGLDFSWVPGDIVEVDEAAAAGWADGERAELAPDDAEITAQPAPTSPEEEPKDDGPFEPTEHSVKEVLAYLATADEEEAVRVLDTEAAADTPRKGITKEREAILAAARERTVQEAYSADQLAAEKAAEFSHGGGSAAPPETRTE